MNNTKLFKDVVKIIKRRAPDGTDSIEYIKGVFKDMFFMEEPSIRKLKAKIRKYALEYSTEAESLSRYIESRERNTEDILKGFFFELFCYLFLSETRVIYNISDISVLDGDYGVDMWATRNGHKVAIQIKFRADSDHILTASEMGNFLGVAHANGVPYLNGHVYIMTNLKEENVSGNYLRITKEGFGDNAYSIGVIGKSTIENLYNRDRNTGYSEMANNMECELNMMIDES